MDWDKELNNIFLKHTPRIKEEFSRQKAKHHYDQQRYGLHTVWEEPKTPIGAAEILNAPLMRPNDELLVDISQLVAIKLGWTPITVKDTDSGQSVQHWCSPDLVDHGPTVPGFAWDMALIDEYILKQWENDDRTLMITTESQSSETWLDSLGFLIRYLVYKVSILGDAGWQEASARTLPLACSLAFLKYQKKSALVS